MVEDSHRLHAAYDDRWKYVLKLRPWGSEELYDLKNDPKELNNLIAKETKEAERLARELHARHLGDAFPGFRLRVASDPASARKVALRLTTNGRFTHVSEDGVSSIDSVELSADRKAIDLKLLMVMVVYSKSIVGRDRPISRPVNAPDVTELTIAVEPADSEIRLEVKDEETKKGPRSVRRGVEKAELPFAFAANDAALEVRALPGEDFPKGGLGISVYRPRGAPLEAAHDSRRAPKSELESLPPDVAERLRALGYDPGH
jgi:hypothetical protein